MTSDVRAVPSLAPWGARLVERLGVEPLWTGLVLGLALAAAVVAYEHAQGHVLQVLVGDVPTVRLRAPIVAMLLIGLAPAAQLYLSRWTGEHLRQLAPLVEGGVPDTPPSARPGRWVGAATGVAFMALFVFPSTPVDGGGWPGFHDLYPFPMVGTLGWLVGRFTSSVLADALLFSRLAGRLGSIDLLDRSAIEPFVHQGLRSALLMVLLIAITCVLALSPGDRLAGAIIVMAAGALVAGAALVTPVSGVRTRIRAEKARQLVALRSQIERRRRAVVDGNASTDDVVGLPGLLALEERIASVREWPFDAPSLFRFTFYLLIGLGSWVGAAGVERLIDWSFG